MCACVGVADRARDGRVHEVTVQDAIAAFRILYVFQFRLDPLILAALVADVQICQRVDFYLFEGIR
jgi:hypothetical protein